MPPVTKTPRPISGSLKRALRAATTMSASSIHSTPAPTTQPCTAATTGFDRPTIARATSWTSARIAGVGASLTSRPALKARPLPRSTTTRTSGDSSARRSASSSACAVASSIAFRRFGRSRRRVSTWSARSLRNVIGPPRTSALTSPTSRRAHRCRIVNMPRDPGDEPCRAGDGLERPRTVCLRSPCTHRATTEKTHVPQRTPGTSRAPARRSMTSRLAAGLRREHRVLAPRTATLPRSRTSARTAARRCRSARVCERASSYAATTAW